MAISVLLEYPVHVLERLAMARVPSDRLFLCPAGLDVSGDLSMAGGIGRADPARVDAT